MYRHKIAMTLSCIYCGIGQIYKGQVMKGVVLIMLYTSLIFVTFFTQPWVLINTFGLLILIIMWIAGMLDAYIYSDNSQQYEPFIQLARKITLGLAVFLSFIILSLYMILQSPRNEKSVLSSGFISSNVIAHNVSSNVLNPVFSEGTAEKQLGQQHPDTLSQEVIAKPKESLTQPNIEKDVNTYISIQVGVFSKQDAAERVKETLRNKGYYVKVFTPVNGDAQKIYKVRVGKFQREDNAQRIAQILRKNEGIETILVHVTEE